MNTIDTALAAAAKSPNKVNTLSWGKPARMALIVCLPGSKGYEVERKAIAGQPLPEYFVRVEYLAPAGMDDDPLSFQPGLIVRARHDDHKCLAETFGDRAAAEKMMLVAG